VERHRDELAGPPVLEPQPQQVTGVSWKSRTVSSLTRMASGCLARIDMSWRAVPPEK